MRAGQIIQDGSVLWKVVDSRAVATETEDGLMSAADKAKLNGIEKKANNYDLPIATDKIMGGVRVGEHIKVIDGVISIDKDDIVAALGFTPPTPTKVTEDADGLMSVSDKLKLDNIEERANRYILPNATEISLGGVRVGKNILVNTGTISVPNAGRGILGVVRIGANITNSDGLISINKDDVTNALGYVPPTQDTVTAYQNGLMSRTDKVRLDGIEDNANKYILPNATAETLGGVKIGTNVAINNGIISIPYASTNAIGVVQVGPNIDVGANGKISVATATSNILGLVKIGANISVNNGTVSVPYGNTSVAGVVKVGANINSGNGGEISVPIGTNTILGVVKIGTNVAINNGTVSVPYGNTTTAGVLRVGTNLLSGDNGMISVATTSGSNLGVVRVGSNISVTNGVISITKDNVTNALGYVPPTQNVVTRTTNGLMSAGDKSKLDGIAYNANNYSLPVASGGTLGGVRTGANITNDNGTISLSYSNVTSALGYAPPSTNTTYGVATSRSDGLMSAADKSKLDGIQAGAGSYVYTLPAATSSVLGGVKIGSNISVNNGTISLSSGNVTNALGYTPPRTNTTYSVATTSANGLMSAADKAKLDKLSTTTSTSGSTTSSYTLPTATSSVLGGVKIGSNISINGGVISVPAATASVLGAVKIGANISVSNGTISLSKNNITAALGYTPATEGSGGGTSSYTLPNATSSVLGGVKIGSNIVVNNGTISVPAATTSALGVVKIGSNIAVSSGTISVPAASSSVLGAVKIGSNITNSNGTISLTKTNITNALGYTPATQTSSGGTSSYVLPNATSSVLGGVKIGSNIVVNNGTISVPAASNSVFGVVKIGSNITNSSGTISINKTNVTTALGYTPPTQDTTYSNATTTTAGLMSAADKTKLDQLYKLANVVVKSPSSAKLLTYNRNSQSPTWNDYDTSQVSISGGQTSAVDAGVYDVNFGTRTGYVFSDGSKAMTTSWEIQKADPVIVPNQTSISLDPSNSTTKITVSGYYDGNLNVTASSNSYITYSVSGKEITINYKAVGKTTLTISANAGSNYNAGSTTLSVSCDKLTGSLSLSASSVSLNINSSTTTLTVSGTYDGNINLSVDNGNCASASLSGNKITVTFRGQGNTTLNVRVPETTKYKELVKSIPIYCSRVNGSLTLNPTSLTLSPNKNSGTIYCSGNYDGDLHVSSSPMVTTQVVGSAVLVTYAKAGTTNLTVSADAGARYNSVSKIFSVTCDRVDGSLRVSSNRVTLDPNNKTAKITVSGSYDGSLSASVVDSSIVSATVSGNEVTVTFKKAGSTTVTIKTAQGDRYNATSTDISITCNRTNGSLTLSSTETTLSYINSSTSISISGNYDGTLTASSANENCAKARISGTNVFITYAGIGSTRITVTAEAGDQYNATSQTIDVTCTKVALNDCTPSQIRGICQAGNADDFWDIGDTHSIRLQGSVGGVSLYNHDTNIFIIGFDHNTDAESSGKHTVTFQFAKLANNWTVGFEVGRFINDNTGVSTEGYQRNQVSDLCNSMYQALTSDWRNVLITVKKWQSECVKTYNATGNYKYITDKEVKSANAIVFALSYYEYAGNISAFRSYLADESLYCKRYDYYRSNGLAFYNHTGGQTTYRAVHLVRSVGAIYSASNSGYGDPYYVEAYTADGQRPTGTSNVSFLFAPAFVVG